MTTIVDEINCLQFEPLSWPLGAQIGGVDLTKRQSNDEIQTLERALATYGVLLIRGQEATLDQVLAFSRQFGELAHMPSAYDTGLHPDYGREVYVVTNEPQPDGKPSPTLGVGRGWHYDQIFMPNPNLARVLHCVAAPALGATTIFANQALAYDALSPTFRNLLQDLRANYDRSLVNRERGIALRPDDVDSLYAVHPIVRAHPVTGRKALYIQRQMFTHFDGMTAEESQPIVQFLHTHTTQPTFTYRHFWKPGDTVIWDNRFVMHLAPPDYDLSDLENPANRRTMYGITIGGDMF